MIQAAAAVKTLRVQRKTHLQANQRLWWWHHLLDKRSRRNLNLGHLLVESKEMTIADINGRSLLLLESTLQTADNEEILLLQSHLNNSSETTVEEGQTHALHLLETRGESRKFQMTDTARIKRETNHQYLRNVLQIEIPSTLPVDEVYSCRSTTFLLVCLFATVTHVNSQSISQPASQPSSHPSSKIR